MKITFSRFIATFLCLVACTALLTGCKSGIHYFLFYDLDHEKGVAAMAAWNKNPCRYFYRFGGAFFDRHRMP